MSSAPAASAASWRLSSLDSSHYYHANGSFRLPGSVLLRAKLSSARGVRLEPARSAEQSHLRLDSTPRPLLIFTALDKLQRTILQLALESPDAPPSQRRVKRRLTRLVEQIWESLPTATCTRKYTSRVLILQFLSADLCITMRSLTRARRLDKICIRKCKE